MVWDSSTFNLSFAPLYTPWLYAVRMRREEGGKGKMKKKQELELSESFVEGG